MKTCPVCKAECADDDKFCTACGTSFTAAEPKAEEPKQEPKRGFPYENPVDRTPAQANLKKLLTSPVALIIAIVFTIMAVCAVATTWSVPQAIATYAGEAFDYLENSELWDMVDDPEIESYMEEAQGIIGEVGDSLKGQISSVKSLISAITANAGAILIAVSMWLIYGTAKDESRACCGTTGFTIIKVLKILALIGCCLLLALLAVLAGFGVSALKSNPDTAEFVSVAWVGVAVLAVIAVLIVLYRVAVLRNLNRMSNVALTGGPAPRIAVYPAVMLIISGVVTALFTLALAALTVVFGPLTLPALFSNAASAVGDFCLGKLFFRAKAEITA